LVNKSFHQKFISRAKEIGMRKLIALAFLFSVNQLHAQKNIDGLINAEKSFAAYSVQNSTKDAFLKFVDSNGIVFDQAKPVNGIEFWSKREKRPFILEWHPQFAEIASSNDFGYTTGPWTFQTRPANDTILARGQYSTVWHIDAKGEWKFLVDLGVGNTPANSLSAVKKVDAKKIKGNPNTDEVTKAEQNFINAYKQNKVDAYKNYLSAQSILNRNGYLPATENNDQSKLISETPSNIQYSIQGSGIASSGDIAYVYGNTVINDKNENYLHIWRKEKTGWKLALEVLRY